MEGLLEFLEEKTDELNAGSKSPNRGTKILAKLGSFIDNKKAPEGLNLSKILFNVLVKHDYSSMGTLQNKSMFLGMMHFQDKYNHDEERLMRCDIHYVTPDQRIIPFCSFNVFPNGPESYPAKVRHTNRGMGDEGVDNEQVALSWKSAQR